MTRAYWSLARRWTPDEDEALREMSAAGLAAVAIAEALGRSPTSVYQRRDLLRARDDEALPPPRPCLKCREYFGPRWKGNFICTPCTGINAYMSGALDDHHVAAM